MENKIGLRLKYFRERALMSQFKLEVDIGASPGTISRIEQGHVNPTKETIIKVAEILKLNNRELDYIIGITAEPPTQEEIEMAKKEVAEYFSKKGVFAYLLDERWRFHFVSNSFRKIVKLTQEEILHLYGNTTVRAIVDNNLPITKILSQSHYKELLKIHIPYYFGQVNFMKDDKYYKNTVNHILKHKVASEIWREMDLEAFSNYNPQIDRTDWFKIGAFDSPMTFARESLLKYSRFEVVEYTPQSKFINIISKFI